MCSWFVPSRPSIRRPKYARSGAVAKGRVNVGGAAHAAGLAADGRALRAWCAPYRVSRARGRTPAPIELKTNPVPLASPPRSACPNSGRKSSGGRRSSGSDAGDTVERYGARLGARASGPGQAANGVGKILGPLSLALIAGSSNVVSPQATSDAVLPAYLFLAFAMLLVGLSFVFLAVETRGKAMRIGDEEPAARPRAMALGTEAR